MKPQKHHPLLALLVGLATGPFTPLIAGNIDIYYGEFRQQIHGFGGSITLDAETIPEKLENDGNPSTSAYTQLFSGTGLDVSFLRVTNWYQHTGLPPVGYNPDGDTYQDKWSGTIKIMSKFRSMQPDGRIMMTAWSPPAFLKSSNSTIGTWNNNSLKKLADGQFNYWGFAWWWLNSLRDYDKNHSVGSITSLLPDYLSIQNEPDNNTLSEWEGCVFTNWQTSEDPNNANYTKAFDTTYDLVKNEFPGIKFIAPDLSSPSTALGNIDKLLGYVNVPGQTLGTKVNLSKVDAIAFHAYGMAPQTQVNAMRLMNSTFPRWEVAKYQTEYNARDDAADGAYRWMSPAKSIHNFLNHAEVNAYLVWDLLYGCINPVTSKPIDGQYYSLAHYSKYVRPGDWRVRTADSDGVWASAYRHYLGAGKKDRLVVVMINTTDVDKTMTLRGLTSAGAAYDYWAGTGGVGSSADRKLQVITTGPGSKRLQAAPVLSGSGLGGTVTLTVGGNTLTTVIIN